MGRLCLRNVLWLMVLYFSVLSLGTPKKLRKVEKLKRKVCDTAACKERGELLRGMLDNNTDPCDSFYDYVCKKWRETHPIPDDKEYYASFIQLGMDVETELKDILGNATLSFQSPEEPNITHKILNVYQSCLNENISEVESMDALREIMRQVGIAVWPVSSTYVNIPNWKNTLTKLATTLGIRPIINIYVSQDARDVTRYGLEMDQPPFGTIGRNQFLHQSNEHNRDIIHAYKRYIMGIASLMTNCSMEQKDLKAFADEMVDFEVQIANRTRSQEQRRDYDAMYKKVTVRDLKKSIPQFPWLKFFKDVLKKVNIDVDKNEPVVVWEMGYYQSVLEFLQTVKRSTLHNYFGFKIVSSLGTRTSENFHKLRIELEKVVYGIKNMEERWAKCVTDLQRYAGHALGRIYVEKMFKPEAKKETETFVNALKETMHKLIDGKEWMDPTTKKEAKKKVDTMEPKIGYADWLMNDSYLAEKYKYVDMFQPDTPYVKVTANLRQNLALTELAQLRTYYNKTTEWLIGAAVVNAFYNPGANDISFPAAVLQPPFYKYGLPLSLNMGGMGMIIGHEVTHAFDDTGSQFNAEGKLYNWWTNETRVAYKNLTECFIEQYGSINDSQTSLLLNGVNTQGENVADNGGLIGAYRTYKKLSGRRKQYPDLALPRLEHLTSDQMFFISNAVVWCDNIRDEALRHMIQYAPHSPGKYRIIVPMSNMPEFSEAFGCKQGQPMNPPKKCRVW